MTETEVYFRAALHDERFATAAVLLAQVVAARYRQYATLSLPQEIRLQRHCQELVQQRNLVGAEALVRTATRFLGTRPGYCAK